VKVLRVHSYYRLRAGEDVAADAERDLVASAGHEVIDFVRYNTEVDTYGLVKKLTLGPRTIWAWDAHRDLRDLLARTKPDIAHFTNLFPLISPAAYHACRAENVPVIQSIHNFRLFCPSGKLMRNGRVCEECMEHSLWRGVRYGCYEESRVLTSVVASMLAVHRALGTYTNLVDCYIALLEFAKRKLTEAGIPGERIAVKPNFLQPDPGVRKGGGFRSIRWPALAGERVANPPAGMEVPRRPD